MGKGGSRKWTQEKTSLDTEIISDVRYLMNTIRQQIADDNWDLTDIKRFRQLRFITKTVYDPDSLREYDAIFPMIITMDDEYDFEIEWKQGTRAFNIVKGKFLIEGKSEFTIDLSDFE